MRDEVLRLPDVQRQLGLSRSAIYSRIATGDFPKQISLGKGARAIGFLRSEVDGWLARQVKRSRQRGHQNRD